jgi:formylmethanofuran dehydrogenase subunit A
MTNSSNLTGRKKFIKWGLGLISSFTILKMVTPAGVKQEAMPKAVKMLDENGNLVEVMQSTINRAGKKITDKQLQNWIKK